MTDDPYRFWDLEDFEPKLDDWRQEVQPPDDVYALVEKWIETRRDRPHGDAVAIHDEGMFDETYWRAPVKDIYNRTVTCHGREVWCYYSVHQNANMKKLVCEGFLSV